MRAVVLAAAVLGIAGSAFAQSAGGYYKNERWGYKVRAPADFKEAALSASEEWIASKHIATRLLYAKNSEFMEADYPQMWVIGFPKSRQGERGAKITEKEDGSVEIDFKNPYKDYKDFVKRESWFVGGGYYFSQEEEDTVGGVSVTKYEIKVEKMVSSPYRIVTWVYHFDDADFAVQCKVLEDYWKKYDSAFLACLKSLKRIEREGSGPGAVTTGNKIIFDEDEDDLTPEEKAKRRQEIFEKTLERETGALPKEWFVIRSDHHVVMSNGSRKYAKEILDHADAIRGYLEKTFGDFGKDYVPPGIIRVFATDAELQAYHVSTSANWWDWAKQVTVSEESAQGRKSWALEPVSDGVTGLYLNNRNRMLHENMPWWFRRGLERHMRFARSKGKRVEIKPDEVDREIMRDIVRSGKAVGIKALFEAGDEEEAYGYQCGSVVSYLLTKGDRGKWKNCIRNYMGNLITATEAAEKEFKDFKDKQKAESGKAAEEGAGGEQRGESEDESGEDEEEGEKYWEQYRDAMRKKEKDIRKLAFERTFGDISDKDWERLDKQWRDWAD